MLRKLLAWLGAGMAGTRQASARIAYAPYQQPASNLLYNLLFGDDPHAFMPRHGIAPAPWHAVLFGNPLDLKAVRTLAEDATTESRARSLAYALLRKNKQPVPAKVLLGVVLEVPMREGLDTVAVFADAGVRYINHTGKVTMVEGETATLGPIVIRLLAAAQAVVARTAPWDQPRKAPPANGSVRLSFLVSDGMYLGEGPALSMEHDPFAGPVIQQALLLLQALSQGVAKPPSRPRAR
jgi:hypothetical protein